MKHLRGFTRTQLLLMTTAVVLIFVCAAVAFGDAGILREPKRDAPLVTPNVTVAARGTVHATRHASPAAAPVAANSSTHVLVATTPAASPTQTLSAASSTTPVLDATVQSSAATALSAVDTQGVVQQAQRTVTSLPLQPLDTNITLRLP